MTDPADRILGPPGVLPPGGWATGSQVVAEIRGNAERGIIVYVDPVDGGLLIRFGGVRDTALGHEDAGPLRLDLTEGCLGPGTRALWHLLGLGEQPLTPPEWRWGLWGHCWMLGWDDDDDGARWYAQSGLVYQDCNRGMVIPDLPGAGEDRRALAMTLATVAEARR